MAGGEWQVQDKNRPGAYINFKAVKNNSSLMGERGVVTMPLALSWGVSDKIIEVLSTDLIDGKSLSKVGYTAFDSESLILREALKNAYKVLVYRIDTGGAKATEIIGNLTVVAKYAGILGNSIAIVIKTAKNGKFDVITTFKGLVKDTQNIATLEDLVSNDFVDFDGTGSVVATAGTYLADGTDGTVTDANYANYFEKIKGYFYNVLALPVKENETLAPIVKSLVQDSRENKGKKVQAVLYNYKADYEGIISVDQGYKINKLEVPVEGFIGYVAGLTAGSKVNKSNTYHVINGVTDIINEKSDSAIEESLLDGKMVLSKRQDGSIIIEQDINTLVNYGANKNKSFSKNRVIRVLDDIANVINIKFSKYYIGSVDNTEQGRTVFRADIISYFKTLEDLGAIQEFNPEEIEVLPGIDIDAVVVNVAVKPADAMEKLYMTVTVK